MKLIQVLLKILLTRIKKILTLKNKSLASEKVSPRLSHKEIKQKWQELYRAGLSETDVIKKNIEGLNRRTVYRRFKKLREKGTNQRK